jgi:hypothetical protein
VTETHGPPGHAAWQYGLTWPASSILVATVIAALLLMGRADAV